MAAQRIVQGYLSSDGPSIRIRCRDGDFFLTVKTGCGLVRREIEVPVPPAQGAELLELAGDVRLEKLRFEIGRWEVDCFQGSLSGLVLAEVELDRVDEPLPPVPVGLELVREVTMNPAFTNHSLARLGKDEARRFVDQIER